MPDWFWPLLTLLAIWGGYFALRIFWLWLGERWDPPGECADLPPDDHSR